MAAITSMRRSTLQHYQMRRPCWVGACRCSTRVRRWLLSEARRLSRPYRGVLVGNAKSTKGGFESHSRSFFDNKKMKNPLTNTSLDNPLTSTGPQTPEPPLFLRLRRSTSMKVGIYLQRLSTSLRASHRRLANIFYLQTIRAFTSLASARYGPRRTLPMDRRRVVPTTKPVTSERADPSSSSF
jgi:hypothetical protein